MSEDRQKRIAELTERYFGSPTEKCPVCGMLIYVWTVPELGDKVEGIGDTVYAPVEYFVDWAEWVEIKPGYLSRHPHECLYPRIVGTPHNIKPV